MTMSKKTIIVITGLGGSGTRLYGNIIKNLNIDLGKDINTAYDNLDTFHNTNYYNNIKEKFTFKDYNNWKEIFNKQLKRGYIKTLEGKEGMICIKEPNFHILIHMLDKFCLEEEYNLKCIHVVRDGYYMINSKNTRQSRWYTLFPDLGDKLEDKYIHGLYWYLANKRCINYLEDHDISHIKLKYDDFLVDPNTQLKTITNFLNLEETNLDIFNNIIKSSKRVKNRSEKENTNNIPKNLTKKIDEIHNLIKCT